MAHIEMFDPRLIALLAEVRNHPELVKKITAAELAGQNAHSLIFTFDSKKDENIDIIRTAEEGLGFIAAYVGILLDGDYTMEDIYGICDKIRGRLEEKRTIHLVSEDGSKKEVKGKIIIPSGYKH
ncbi:hypothetical protein D3C87_600980 [compost metagenome]